MRDLAFIGFLATLLAFGFRRPFLFVLTYVYIDVVSPQRLSYFLLNSIPISLIAFGCAALGWLLVDDKRDVRVAPRQFLLLTLFCYCWWTTLHADFPVEAAFKWDWVYKALIFAMFLPLTLRTKLRIEALLLFMLLSLSSIVVVGGIKTLASGGGYGELNLMVSNNSGLFEGSIISAVSICVIPIILWFTKHGTIFKPDWRVKIYCYALIFACMLIPIGTSARTGLVCIAFLALLMLREVKRKLLYLGAIAAVGLAVIPLLPSSYTARMETIKTYKSDESASTRLAVWGWTLNYVKDHPFGGGFEAYRQNRLSYNLVDTKGKANNELVEKTKETDQARAYHSAYFEMLGEQGWPGLLLWICIHFSGLFRMELIRRRYRKAEGEDAWIAPLAVALQQAHMIYLLGAAFVGIALNPFVYMLVGTQIGFDTYVARKRRENARAPMLRRPPPAAQPQPA
ncbi:putative O-glycosylation ligase, exosortase A system-associated [Stakelama marina]|uniref:Putative O-glycosylation ligase, exosortase A system-associated n=1 Tax=Stakelama marina TaxID=2826939 RepID=A0A8T4INS7_9SPHN|nr:putative O-glycosylation ligase, exosortase A system-associated [Stakelama marina]MBR0553796.1 putative O-glycosylation ligase, exosortase A system-associated [Stakelama marina]